MDPKDLSDSELASMLEIFRKLAHAGRSRFFMDLFLIVEREGVRRSRTTKIENYSDHELRHGVLELKALIDTLKAQNMREDAPLLRFLLLAITVALDEGEKRERSMTTH